MNPSISSTLGGATNGIWFVYDTSEFSDNPYLSNVGRASILIRRGEVRLLVDCEQANNNQGIYAKYGTLAWHKVDNFGYTTLADLASAVGGLQYLGNISDFNDHLGTFGLCGIVSETQNRPSFNYGIAIIFPHSDTQFSLQIAAASTSKAFAYRIGGNAWNEFT